jgi:hypothetical protein
MVAVLVGLLFIVGGLWGVVRWFPDFMVMLKGFGPVSILIGGVVAFITGIASFQSRRVNDKDK